MSFFVHISDSDEAYLDRLPLSAQARERVKHFIRTSIGNVSDEFREDTRLMPGSPYFHVQHLILDTGGDGQLHTVDFFLNDADASCGVLLLVFVDFDYDYGLG